jgi:hypothetical protein
MTRARGVRAEKRASLRNDLSHQRQPRISLFVTLALATLGASCKSNGSGTPRDAAGGSGGAGGADAPRADTARADAAGGDTGRSDGAVADGRPPDLGGPDRTEASVPDAAPPDAGPTNPARLWFSGPESDLHLSDIEPLTPF